MAITAQLIRNESDYRERLDQTEDGWVGQRVYRVIADSIEIALTATGLPAFGDPWNATYSFVRVVGISPEYVGGRDDTGTGLGGVVRVVVTYRSARPSRWTLSPRGPGDVWSEWYVKEDTAKVIYGYDPNTTGTEAPPGDPPIRNGNGAEVKVAKIEVQVRRFYRAGDPINIPRFFSLSRPAKLNLDTVNFPPIKRMGGVLTVTRGQALYVGFDLDYATTGTNEMIGVTHYFDVAENFNEGWIREDANGRPVSNVLTVVRVYEYASFAGLW